MILNYENLLFYKFFCSPTRNGCKIIEMKLFSNQIAGAPVDKHIFEPNWKCRKVESIIKYEKKEKNNQGRS